MRSPAVIPGLERHQVPLYLLAVAAGVVIGWQVPGAAALDVAINPVIALLLFATFCGVPFQRLRHALADRRFLAALGVLNFVVAPLVAFGLSRFVAADDALVLGVLLVLLTPCIDYVLVFTQLAGGAREKLLAATPALMLAQLLLLPLYLRVFIGPEVTGLVRAGPFLEAFGMLIAAPLIAAVVVQWAGRRWAPARTVLAAMEAAMVPLMMATLTVVIASQVRAVGERAAALLTVLPLYVAFAVLMVTVGMVTARLAGTDTAASRALTFSGVTRNSLVVLPLALAVPPALALVPLVVVTQTLVELTFLVLLVRALPRLQR